MKKIWSLIKACMTSDMSLFKIKTKNKKASLILPLVIAGYLMFVVGMNANTLFEKFASLNLLSFLLALIILSVSVMTIIEGVYKSESLLFNCKDDQLLLSLPIKRSTVLIVRIFKYYVFELLFNSLFFLPVIIVYTRWVNVTWTYYLTSFLMLLLLPIIPIVISCIIGALIAGISSHFKYKNIVQIVISMVFVLGVMYLSFNMNSIIIYLEEHATSMNDFITKLYYPAGVYSKLVTDFNFIDLLIFIIVNIGLFTITILVLGKIYFKINSRLKKVVTNTKKNCVNSLSFKAHRKSISLIKKEINTFFKIPVFIVNAGFALVLFIVGTLLIVFKFDSVISLLENSELGIEFSKEVVLNNTSIIIFLLVSLTSFMTSITNSVISLEGKNIVILKALPIKPKTILMSKVYAPLMITTPVLLLGECVLFVKFQTGFIEIILTILLSILMPLTSHFIGLIVNLKYPKLEWENATEVVKQSASSFISVMIGMVLFIMSVVFCINVIGQVSSTLILLMALGIFMVIDIILYCYLVRYGTNKFNKLSI